MRRVVLLAALFGLLAFALPGSALAQVVAHISLSTQRMNVSIDGVPRFNRAVSTARPGYRTPTGTFKPTALFRYHASTIYSGSPMPYSIFFLRGYAIHGRDQISWAARLSWLRPAAPVQRRSALLAGEDLWTLEHGDSHQLLVFLPLVL